MKLTLGEKIKELRKRDGRKQEDLANALGITNQAVSRWEKDGSYPDMEMIPAIANYFGISIDELFGYEISGSLFAPFFRYALILSPYKNKSFPSTIPHCIKSDAEPVTKGAAKLVPVKFEYPPPALVLITFTDGATKSGFTYITFSVYPFPENDVRISLVASYPPTVITF